MQFFDTICNKKNYQIQHKNILLLLVGFEIDIGYKFVLSPKKNHTFTKNLKKTKKRKSCFLLVLSNRCPVEIPSMVMTHDSYLIFCKCVSHSVNKVLILLGLQTYRRSYST